MQKAGGAPPAGQPEAAAAIWDWRVRRDVAAGAAAGRVRRALLHAAVGGVAGGLLWFRASRPMGGVVLGITAAVLLMALISPGGAYATLERGMARFGRAVGEGVSWVLLTPIFYLVLTPIGLLARRGRRDSMKRFYEREAATYWVQRRPKDPSTRGRPF